MEGKKVRIQYFEKNCNHLTDLCIIMIMRGLQSKFNVEICTKLIMNAQGGQESAHEHIFITFSSAVYNLALKTTADRQVAEDILQETFINLIRNIHQFRFESPFGLWLRKITVNQILMHIRKHNPNEKITDSLSGDGNVLNFYHSSDNHEQVPSDASRLHSLIDLKTLLDKLSVKTRTVLWLKEVEGYTHQEIGDMLDKTASYSKSLVARAYHTLRDRYNVEGNKHIGESK